MSAASKYRTLTPPERRVVAAELPLDRDLLDDDDVELLAIVDAFGQATPEAAAFLRGEILADYLAALRTLSSSIHRSLEAAPPDAPWRGGAQHLRKRLDLRLRQHHERAAIESRRHGSDLARRLRNAIKEHRAATLGDDYEPTPADRTLWETIGLDDDETEANPAA